jgi:sphingolipid delta-4 desaturase
MLRCDKNTLLSLFLTQICPMKKFDYKYVDFNEPHSERRREIIQKYPEAVKLMGSYPLSALYVLLIVITQFAVAYLLRDQAWWLILIVAYCFGAFLNHGLCAMIHEAAHNMIFKKPFHNKLMGIFCDLPMVLPSSMGFRKYHLVHHTNMGEFSYDADLVSHFEGNMVGNSWWRKMLWLGFFMISQGIMRPARLNKIKLWNKWIVANLIIILSCNAAIFYYIGPFAFLYLFLSTFFGLGLHPLGGRWIQEHYLTNPEQETYSYYGILNKLTFNIGYHNEHHDLFQVPWINLPKVKKLAPEYYDNLDAYQSWSGLMYQFFFDKNLSPFSRTLRPDNEKNAKRGMNRF